MKSYLLLGAALSMVQPMVAQAQDAHQHRDGGNADQGQSQGSHEQAQGQGQRPQQQGFDRQASQQSAQRQQGAQNDRRAKPQHAEGQHIQPQHTQTQWRQDGSVDASARSSRMTGHPSGAQEQQRFNGTRQTTPTWRGQVNRSNQGRQNNFQRLRANPFRYPSGYGYRRWSVGLMLPSIFLSSDYYYDDYAYFGVSAPPRGCHWVRYGSDLLLVNRRTGRIIRIIYDAFY